jgi:hypothetical protein
MFRHWLFLSEPVRPGQGSPGSDPYLFSVLFFRGENLYVITNGILEEHGQALSLEVSS